MTDGPDEYPTDEELPDDPVSVGDIDPFIVSHEDYDDINAFATAELVAQAAKHAYSLTDHFDDPLIAGIKDAANDRFVRPDQEFEF
jgi:hypothetical protein